MKPDVGQELKRSEVVTLWSIWSRALACAARYPNEVTTAGERALLHASPGQKQNPHWRQPPSELQALWTFITLTWSQTRPCFTMQTSLCHLKILKQVSELQRKWTKWYDHYLVSNPKHPLLLQFTRSLFCNHILIMLIYIQYICIQLLQNS